MTTCRQAPSPTLGLLLGAAILLTACGSNATEPFPTTRQQSQVTEEVSFDPVGPFGRCIADLSTTRVVVMTPPPDAPNGVIGSATSPEEVRLGAVPSPPSSRELSAAPLVLGSGGPAELGQTSFHVYSTPCYPFDVMTFYTEVLRENQWSGDFTPIGPLTKDNTYVGPKQHLDLAAQQPDPRVTRYDLETLSHGLFTNVNPTGVTITVISIVAAIEGPRTGATEHHPTYVQVMVQQRQRADRPPLAPPVFTTPNVGASGGPPNNP